MKTIAFIFLFILAIVGATVLGNYISKRTYKDMHLDVCQMRVWALEEQLRVLQSKQVSNTGARVLQSKQVSNTGAVDCNQELMLQIKELKRNMDYLRQDVKDVKWWVIHK